MVGRLTPDSRHEPTPAASHLALASYLHAPSPTPSAPRPLTLRTRRPHAPPLAFCARRPPRTTPPPCLPHQPTSVPAARHLGSCLSTWASVESKEVGCGAN
ncbi:hypothetical protein GUJ93_ZPchr0010g9841 [Zizania palustris]|uniref:Uncharacterized protein n=1 Tax=Zizania palustris TaxID=103762 RepID=A0A8J5WEW7_ZIZPA|nr:hypothetical protein GUJ93_ZPchr0010g9841 [Zizania palustris]